MQNIAMLPWLRYVNGRCYYRKATVKRRMKKVISFIDIQSLKACYTKATQYDKYFRPWPIETLWKSYREIESDLKTSVARPNILENYT